MRSTRALRVVFRALLKTPAKPGGVVHGHGDVHFRFSIPPETAELFQVSPAESKITR